MTLVAADMMFRFDSIGLQRCKELKNLKNYGKIDDGMIRSEKKNESDSRY